MQRFAVALGRLCALGRPVGASQCVQCRALASLASAAGPLANTVLDERQNTHRAASTSGVAGSEPGHAAQTATAPPWLSSTVSKRRGLLGPRLWERSLATVAGTQEGGQDLGIASKLVYHQSQRQTRREEQEKLQAAVTLQARGTLVLLANRRLPGLHREVQSVGTLCGEAAPLRARWWNSCRMAQSARGARRPTRWGWSRGTCRCSSRVRLGLTRPQRATLTPRGPLILFRTEAVAALVRADRAFIFPCKCAPCPCHAQSCSPCACPVVQHVSLPPSPRTQRPAYSCCPLPTIM